MRNRYSIGACEMLGGRTECGVTASVSPGLRMSWTLARNSGATPTRARSSSSV